MFNVGIPKTSGFLINFINWNTAKIMLRDTKTIEKSSLNSHVYWDTLSKKFEKSYMFIGTPCPNNLKNPTCL